MVYEALVRALIGLVMVVAACSAKDTAGSSVDGADLYAKFCATCHGVDGKPDPTMTARLGVRDLTSPEFRARATPALVENQIRKGSQNKLMPAFEGAFTDAQLAAIAEYVMSSGFGKR